MKKIIVKEGTDKIISNSCTLPITILNIGAGNILPIDLYKFDKTFLLNIDSGYDFDICDDIKSIDLTHHKAVNNNLRSIDGDRYLFRSGQDIYGFLETYYHKFDLVTIYRFLEHVEFSNVPYFIYLLSRVTQKDSLIDVIVPNYRILAEMILDDDPNSTTFEHDNILLTTELLNEPNDPHASIWTVGRLLYFFELEKRFQMECIRDFEFENRDIYLRAIFRRV
jgi:hypothetical protein